MALTYKDIALENEAFSGLADTLLKNRMLAEQKAERQQSARVAAAERSQDVDFRERELAQRIKAEEDRARAEDEALGIRQQNADTAQSKGSKVYYFVSPSTKNVMSFTGTPQDAQAQLEKVQASKPDENIVMTDKMPDGLKDLNEIVIDDQHTLHASDADALKYYEGKIAAKAKVDAAAAKPAPGVAPRQTVRQVLNPARVAGGVVDTNQPPYLTLTNTTTGMPPIAPGLPNLAPANSPASNPTPTAKDVSYLAAHPEMKAKFEAKFGVGSADKYLP